MTRGEARYDDLRPQTLRVTSVWDRRGRVIAYAVHSPQDPDRWPDHLAKLLEMVPGATFDAASRTWTVRARQWRWLIAALGGHHVLALDWTAGKTLGLPYHQADTAASAHWPVGKDVLDVLGAMHEGAILTETPGGPVLVARDGTRRPVPGRTWQHLFRMEAVEQLPREQTCRMTGYGRELVTDPQVLRAANRRRIEPHRSAQAMREQLVLGDRAIAASPPDAPDEWHVVAVNRQGPPRDQLLGLPIRNGDVLELKLAGKEQPEWRRVEYRIDRPRDGRQRAKVAWLVFGPEIRFHLWRERMVLRWPEEAGFKTASAAGVAHPPPPGPAGAGPATR